MVHGHEGDDDLLVSGCSVQMKPLRVVCLEKSNRERELFLM